MTRLLLSIAAAVALAFVVEAPAMAGEAGAGTKPIARSPAGFRDVIAPGLRDMLARKDFVLINVHIPYAGEIERTDLFIPFDEIAGRVGALPARKDAKIVLYCRSGHMSVTAAGTLAKLGYTNVWNLEGGMLAWSDAGYALQDRRH
jgi:rhodanese-related sulfurtransferase